MKKFTLEELQNSDNDRHKAIHSYLIEQKKQDKEYSYFIFKNIEHSEISNLIEISSYSGYEDVTTSYFQMIYIYKNYTYNSCYLHIFHENKNNIFKKIGNAGLPAKETELEKIEILKSINFLKEKHKIDNF